MDAMHDQCKHVVAFHNNLMHFFKSLLETIPATKPLIKAAGGAYKALKRAEYIAQAVGRLTPHMRYINEMDQGILSNDYYPGQPLELLPGLDVKQLWTVIKGEPGVDVDATRTTLFKYFQVLFLNGGLALKQTQAFDATMGKQAEILSTMMERAGLDDAVRSRMVEMQGEEDAADAADGNNLGAMMGMLGGGLDLEGLLGGAEGNVVMELATQMVEDLNLNGDDFSDPMAAVQSLMANNGERMQDLVMKIGQQLETKINSGEVDRSVLEAQAQKMKGMLGSVGGMIPGMDKVISGLQSVSEVTDEGELIAKMKSVYDTATATGAPVPPMDDVFATERGAWTADQEQRFMQFLSAQMFDADLENHTA